MRMLELQTLLKNIEDNMMNRESAEVDEGNTQAAPNDAQSYQGGREKAYQWD